MSMQAVYALSMMLLMNTAACMAADMPYKLHQGDSLQVSVWKEDGLQRDVHVLPDGSITIPLAGRIEVAGLNTPEVEKRIAEKLKAYIPDPTVTVIITGTDGNRIYVLGKVAKPGPLVMSGPMSALQALSMAGGLDKFADENSIRVIRSIANSVEILTVRYKSLITGMDMTSNIQLVSGDTILVP